MDNEKRTKFLELVTANPRLPPGGLPQVPVPGQHTCLACCLATARDRYRLMGSTPPSCWHCLGLPAPAQGVPVAACMPRSMLAAPEASALCALCFPPDVGRMCTRGAN